MSTHDIHSLGEIRKILVLFIEKKKHLIWSYGRVWMPRLSQTSTILHKHKFLFHHTNLTENNLL